jgi:hypothetical protein
MAIRSLPRRPSLEHLRNEARALQRRVRAGDPAALAHAREFSPALCRTVDGFGLSDAQLTLARSYGHASWPKLKTYVEAVTIYARDPHELAPRPDAADEFVRLACLVYGGDDLTRPARAAEMLRQDPSLAGRSIQTAAVVGDVAAAARMLAAIGRWRGATGGPFGWEPTPLRRLLTTRQRRSPPLAPRGRPASADHGADPNAAYLWDGTYLFTALTGSVRVRRGMLPTSLRTHESLPLARLLLEAGADPTTTRRSTTATFGPRTTTSSCSSPMGLGTRTPAGRGRSVLGEHLTSPSSWLEDALVLRRATTTPTPMRSLLLRPPRRRPRRPRHAAPHAPRACDLSSGRQQRRTEVRRAAARGRRPPARDRRRRRPARTLHARRARGGRRELARDPSLAEAVMQRHPRALMDAAEHGNADGVELLARIGYDVNLRDDQVALHLAAYQGNREGLRAPSAAGRRSDDPRQRLRRARGGLGPARAPRRARRLAAGGRPLEQGEPGCSGADRAAARSVALSSFQENA